MGNSNCAGSKRQQIDIMQVQEQDKLADSKEVKIMKLRNKNVSKGRDKKYGVFNGFVQRSAYIVIPKIDKLRKDKIQLRRNMQIRQANQEQFTRYRIKNAGKQLTDGYKIYYVN